MGIIPEAKEDRLKVAELILSRFRGRADRVAMATPKGFVPKVIPPMKPEWLAARHLGAEVCLGFYLLTEESKCWCAAVDFDNKAESPDPLWKEKAEKLHVWLAKTGLSPVTEVSQSGNAAHVWIFLSEPTEAWVPRGFLKVACELAGVPCKEIYPRQDFLDEGGIGNLIRYPLWGRSCFVDPENGWEPLPVAAALGVSPSCGQDLIDLALQHGKQLAPGARPKPVLAPGVSDRIRERLKRKGTLLSRRWAGDKAGLADQSRSALVLSIATELVRQFVPTEEIRAAVHAWCQENDYEKGDRPQWIDTTVSKAYDFVFSKVQERSASAVKMRDACHLYLDQLEKGIPTHIPSGIAALDVSIDGVAPGEMAIIAARPSQGKSALALAWLDDAALSGHSSVLISEEMSALELGKRGVAYCSDIDAEQWPECVHMLRSDVDRHYQHRAPIYVVENCTSIDRVEDVIDQAASIQGVRLVAVDYLQLLRGRGESEYDRTTDVSRRLKQCARRNMIGLLALCQLNRELDSRPDHMPRLSDLRATGQIEQDADLAIFLVWPWKYDPETNPPEKFLIHVLKRRNGPIRTPHIETTFTPHRQAFAMPARVF